MNPLLVGGVLDIGSQLIKKLFPDPEQKARAELALLEMQKSGEIKELEIRMSAIVAEAKSLDKWTSRARPAFLYVVYIYLLSALPMGFLFAIHPHAAQEITAGVSGWLSAIPEPIVTLFGMSYLGYCGARSWDKRNLVKGGGA